MVWIHERHARCGLCGQEHAFTAGRRLGWMELHAEQEHPLVDGDELVFTVWETQRTEPVAVRWRERVL